LPFNATQEDNMARTAKRVGARLMDRPEYSAKPRPLTGRTDDTVAESVAAMSAKSYGCIVIVDDDNRVSGIVTERDIARRVVADARDPMKTMLGDIMTRDPDTLAPHDTAYDALDLMRLRGYRHLPVVDGDRLVGIVSVRDLYEVTRSAVQESLEDNRRQHD